MTRISTHVLDISRGQPAAGVAVQLERREERNSWRMLASGRTDQDGRCAELLPTDETLSPGEYRLTFETQSYFDTVNILGLYPSVEITFRVREEQRHFHLPLLLSPNGYTTYRGT